MLMHILTKHFDLNDSFEINIWTLPFELGFIWSHHYINPSNTEIDIISWKRSNWNDYFEKFLSKWFIWNIHLDPTLQFECFEGVISMWVFRRSHFDVSVSKESFRFECFEGVTSIWVFQGVILIWVFITNHSNLNVSK